MARPRLVYDDDCGFCTWSAEVAAERGAFELVGFTELSPSLRGRLPADYERCAHLVTDDRVYSCGAAVEAALARMGPASRAAVGAFRVLPRPVRRRIREPAYRWVADHRAWFGRLVSR